MMSLRRTALFFYFVFLGVALAISMGCESDDHENDGLCYCIYSCGCDCPITEGDLMEGFTNIMEGVSNLWSRELPEEECDCDFLCEKYCIALSGTHYGGWGETMCLGREGVPNPLIEDKYNSSGLELEPETKVFLSVE